MNFKNSETDPRKENNWQYLSIENNKEHQKSNTRSQDKPTFFLQHRGKPTQNFA